MASSTTNRWTLLSPGVWEASYRVPMFESRCVAICLQDCAGTAAGGPKSWVILSPGPDLVESFGQELLSPSDRVEALVVPSSYHTMGLVPFQKAYGPLKIIAAPGAHSRLSAKEIGPLDVELPMLSDYPVQIHIVPETRNGELWMSAGVGLNTCLTVGDAMFNLPEGGSFGFRLFKFFFRAGPGLVMDLPYRWLFLKDKQSFVSWASELMERLDPKLLAPAHGDILRAPELRMRFESVLQSLSL